MMRPIAIAFAAAVLATAVAVPAQAQGPAGGEGAGRQRMGQMNPERMAQRLFEGVELTADQQARVKTINEQFAPKLQVVREEMRAAREAGSAPAPERMQAMRALNAEYRDSLRAVLTAEQQAVFDRNAEASMQRRPPGARQRAAAWGDRGERRARSRIS